MTSLEIYGPPEKLITSDELKASARSEEYLREVAVAKAVRDELLKQHQDHCEKFRSLGPEAFKKFFDLVLEEFSSDLLTPVVDKDGKARFNFERIGPAFFYIFLLLNPGRKYDLWDPISFDIDALRTEDGWAEAMRGLTYVSFGGSTTRFRKAKLTSDEFDSNNIQSVLVCGVLEAIKYERAVLVEIVERRWEKKCSGKTRSVLLASDSKHDDSLNLLVGVNSLYPHAVAEVFKSRSFPKILRGEDSWRKPYINIEEKVDLGSDIDLASLIRAPLLENKHERVFTRSRDLWD